MIFRLNEACKNVCRFVFELRCDDIGIRCHWRDAYVEFYLAQ